MKKRNRTLAKMLRSMLCLLLGFVLTACTRSRPILNLDCLESLEETIAAEYPFVKSTECEWFAGALEYSMELSTKKYSISRAEVEALRADLQQYFASEAFQTEFQEKYPKHEIVIIIFGETPRTIGYRSSARYDGGYIDPETGKSEYRVDRYQTWSDEYETYNLPE